MKRIESDIGAFDFAECGTEHELGSCLAEAHVSYCDDLIHWAGGSKFATILADPPWRFQNSTGKVAPEHKRLRRYATLSLKEILALPVSDIAQETAHLYLWVPNALLPDGLAAMQAWGFTYKTNLVWHKIRKDGGSDGRGCGFYFRNVTEMVLFGVRGKHARTLDPGRRQVNYLATQKREHSRKPDELYPIIEACPPGPHAELFACRPRLGWKCWGLECEDFSERRMTGHTLHEACSLNRLESWQGQAKSLQTGGES